MKKINFTTISLLLQFIVAANLIAEIATVKINSPEKIVSAIGLSITPSGVEEEKNVVIKRSVDNEWLITFDTNDSNKETSSGTLLVTALATTESGATVFSPTVAISGSPKTPTKETACINSQLTSLRQSQIGYIKALISNRSQQRLFAKNSLGRIFEPSVLNELTKLEINLGLYPGYQISQEENAFELLSRCFRLLSALRLLETRRQNLVSETK